MVAKGLAPTIWIFPLGYFRNINILGFFFLYSATLCIFLIFIVKLSPLPVAFLARVSTLIWCFFFVLYFIIVPLNLIGRFSSVVQEFRMTRSTADHSIFYHHTSSRQCIYLIVYVDDIVITCNDQDVIPRVKQHLFNHFQNKGLGKLKYFLGIEITQSKSGKVIVKV